MSEIQDVQIQEQENKVDNTKITPDVKFNRDTLLIVMNITMIMSSWNAVVSITTFSDEDQGLITNYFQSYFHIINIISAIIVFICWIIHNCSFVSKSKELMKGCIIIIIISMCLYLAMFIYSLVSKDSYDVCKYIDNPSSLFYRTEDLITEADKTLCSSSCPCQMKNDTNYQIANPSISYKTCPEGSLNCTMNITYCNNFDYGFYALPQRKIDLKNLVTMMTYLENKYRCTGICKPASKYLFTNNDKNPPVNSGNCIDNININLNGVIVLNILTFCLLIIALVFSFRCYNDYDIKI